MKANEAKWWLLAGARFRLPAAGRDLNLSGSVGVLRTEFAASQPATKLLLGGLACWIGLVVVLTLLGGTVFEFSAWKPGWNGAGSVDASPARVAPKTYDNITQRPVFSRIRNPSVPAPVQQPDAPQTQAASTLERGVVLKGVFMSAPTAKAFIISAHNPTGIWLQSGDQVGGWKVVNITPVEVQLQAPGDQMALQLDMTGGSR